MKGLDIFLHALKQVLANLPGAIRVSALPYAVQVVVTFLLTRPDRMAGMMRDPMAMMQGGPSMIAQFLSLIVLVVTSVWMAVAWHRFILQDEMPAGFVPAFDPDRMVAYFVRALQIGLLCLGLGIVLGFFAGLIGAAVAYVTGAYVISMLIVMLLVYFPILVLGYRLATALPAMAVDRPTSFTAGWDATQGENETFIGLGLISVAALFTSALVGMYILGGIRPLFILWTVAFNWLATMTGLSILTTLYGHFIEKRDLL